MQQAKTFCDFTLERSRSRPSACKQPLPLIRTPLSTFPRHPPHSACGLTTSKEHRLVVIHDYNRFPRTTRVAEAARTVSCFRRAEPSGANPQPLEAHVCHSSTVPCSIPAAKEREKTWVGFSNHGERSPGGGGRRDCPW